jgi:hypothetical protein
MLPWMFNPVAVTGVSRVIVSQRRKRYYGERNHKHLSLFVQFVAENG